MCRSGNKLASVVAFFDLRPRLLNWKVVNAVPATCAPSQEALAAEIKELERLVEQADTDLVVKDSELRNTKREKTTEINRLNALIAEKRETLASISMWLFAHMSAIGRESGRVDNILRYR